MTTVQLAQRLLRYLSVKDIALLSADDALHLLDAINTGIQQFYALAPSIYKQTMLSGILKAEQGVSLYVENGSSVFSGYVATLAVKSYTIVIDGDDVENEIVAANGLLDNYVGTTGTKNAKIYGDCVQLNAVIDRMIADPVLDTGDVLTQKANDVFTQYSQYKRFKSANKVERRRVGKPSQYWIDPIGQSQAGDPAFVLRVDTLPDKDYRVRFLAELSPRKVQFMDLSYPAPLGLDDGNIEAYVLPLCADALTDSPLWQLPESRSVVNSRASMALEMINRLSPSIAVPRNRVGTPRGY